MRDPSGHVLFTETTVIRVLKEAVSDNHFLRSDLAAKWVENGDLIPFKTISDTKLQSPLIEFVVHPTEWTSLQFLLAAKLTIRLQSEANSHGWDLKDASAWNIVFDGLRPVFVDLLSFVPLSTANWRAASQFSTNFILPLLIQRRNKLSSNQCLQLWKDGIPPKSARRLVGPARFLTRYWPLMADIPRLLKGEDGENKSFSKVRNNTDVGVSLDINKIIRHRERLNASLEWMLDGLVRRKQGFPKSTWGDYVHERTHYPQDSLGFKKNTIYTWLNSIKPAWVLDVGCNSGEFSDLAVAVGAKVICWDGDEVALEKLINRNSKKDVFKSYFPVLGSIDCTPSGYGWLGTEFSGLTQRLCHRVDVVMLLAITHHLAISNAIRLSDIFRFAALTTRRYILLEILSEKDERVLQLCLQYDRNPLEFSIGEQLDAARSFGFEIVDHKKRFADDTREYVLLERVVNDKD